MSYIFGRIYLEHVGVWIDEDELREFGYVLGCKRLGEDVYDFAERVEVAFLQSGWKAAGLLLRVSFQFPARFVTEMGRWHAAW